MRAKALTVGLRKRSSVCISQTDLDNGCIQIGRRRLSPPYGAGWEPVNALPGWYLQS